MRDWVTSVIICTIVLLSLVLGLSRIGNVPLWDDEAQVAIIARNHAKGLGLSGFDEKHLLSYVNGTLLDSTGHYRNPPGDVWLTSLSFKILGVGTWQARVPFALCGFFSLILCIGLAKRYLHLGKEGVALTAAWIGLSTSLLLYNTQCRYYAPSMLLTTGSLYAYLSWVANKNRQWHLIVMATCLIGLYYFHYLLFVCFCAAMLIQALAFDRKDFLLRDWWALVILSGAVVIAILPHAFCEKIWHRPDFLWPSDALHIKFWKLARWNFRELSTIAILPIFLLPIIGVVALYNRFMLRIACMVLTFGLVLAILSPQPTAVCDYSDIRYMSAVFPLSALLGAGCCAWLFRQSGLGKAVAIGICVCSVVHNGLAYNSFYNKSTWLLPNYLNEVSSKYPTATTFALNSIQANTPKGSLIRCIPDFFSYPLQFYKGDSYKFGSNITPTSACWNLVNRTSPWHSTDSLPELILIFGDTPANNDTLNQYQKLCRQYKRGQYYAVDTLPCYWPGLDPSRPELWVHEFGPRYLTPRDSWEKIIVWKR